MPSPYFSHETRLVVPGFHRALGRMLRAAIADEPKRCEASAERLLHAFPASRLDQL